MTTLAREPQSAAANQADSAVNLDKHPYIDAHSHVWSPDTKRWPLANNKTQADLAPPSFMAAYKEGKFTTER